MITISYWALAAICLGLGAAAYGVTTVQVCLDSGDLDGDVYLSWLDDRYGGDGDDN